MRTTAKQNKFEVNSAPVNKTHAEIFELNFATFRRDKILWRFHLQK